MDGEGANFTKKNLPVKLVYYEVYPRIDTAFYREHQIKKWRRAKKEALINGDFHLLPALAKPYFKRENVDFNLDDLPNGDLDDLCPSDNPYKINTQQDTPDLTPE